MKRFILSFITLGLTLFLMSTSARALPFYYCGETASCTNGMDPASCTMHGGTPEAFYPARFLHGPVAPRYAYPISTLDTRYNGDGHSFNAYCSYLYDNKTIVFNALQSYRLLPAMGRGNWHGTLYAGFCGATGGTAKDCPLDAQQ